MHVLPLTHAAVAVRRSSKSTLAPLEAVALKQHVSLSRRQHKPAFTPLLRWALWEPWTLACTLPPPGLL